MPWLLKPNGEETEIPDHWDVRPYLAQGFKSIDKPSVKPRLPIPDGSKRFSAYITSVGNLEADGYGRATTNIFRSMEECGYFYDRGRDLHKNLILFHMPGGIHYHLEELRRKGLDLKQINKIGYSMWETSKLPEPWAEQLNALDHLLVPSYFCKEVFESSGVKIPIHVMRIPIDTENFTFKDRDWSAEPFTFLQMAQLTRRKGYHLTLQAFLEEFKNGENVKLILKSRIQVPIICDDPRVQIICASWPEREIVKLLHSAHCFVNPTYGEGQGMCDMEAMSTGITTISTNEHATAEHLHEGALGLSDSKKIKVTFEDMQCWGSLFKENKDLGDWYQPDINKIKEAMRYFYENRKVCMQTSVQAAADMRQSASFFALREETKRIMDEIYA